MNVFLDISLLALIAATIIVCWRKGFVRSILGVGKTLICIVATYLFGASASALVSEHWIGERVTQYVYERLLALFEAGTETFDLSVIVENIPSWVQTFAEKLGIDVAGFIGDLTTVDTAGLQSTAQSMATPITKLISDIIGYAGVYLISLILVSILAYILVKIADLPVIRNVDRALGCALGVCSAFLYASVYTLLLFAVFSLIEGYNPDFAFHTAYDKTWLFHLFYDINIFRWMFGIG
jgi:uncharacterized membrane protein required for colicin V production